MADTRAQREAEQWVVENYLPQCYGQSFSKAKVKLMWGGVFEFDGVSDDGSVVACVSTSSARTASGRLGVGKQVKVHADAFYLNAVEGDATRVLVFTEPDMLASFEAMKSAGRFPADIVLMRAELPGTLATNLATHKKTASEEVSPNTSQDKSVRPVSLIP